MKKNQIAGLLALSALAFSATAAADDSGVFIRGAFGKNKTDFSLLDQRDNAYSLGGGYRFNRYFSIDANYIDLGTPEKRIGSGATASRLSLDSSGYLAGVTGYLPLGGEDSGFELRGKLGIAALDTKGSIRNTLAGTSFNVKDNGKAAYFGIGAGYRFNENLTAGLEFTRIRGKVKPVAANSSLKLNDERDMAAVFVEYKF
jgi:long-subunit fatty acid transport protein